MPGDTTEPKPRPAMVSAKVPCTSSQARTQREQTMHLDGIEGEIGVRFVVGPDSRWLAPLIAVAHLAQAHRAGHVLQLAIAIGRAGQAVERMVGDVKLHHALAQPLAARSVWVRTTMPFATGVVQEAGVPARPSISTRHSRQEPNASSMSVAQSLGILVPSSIAARMIEVPSGTVTACRRWSA